MGIISKLKSVLGVLDPGRERVRDGKTVGVDREPEAAGERAVKGVPGAPEDEPATDVEKASHDVTVDVESETGEPATEDPTPAEATTSVGESAGGVGESVDGEHADGEPVDSIKGIGTAYAERLADAGVHSVEELARADPEELAAATDLGTGRVGNWIERARARTE